MVPEETVRRAPTSTPYRGKSGQWAFLFHRITGFGVFLFLMLHVVDVSLTNNRRLYNDVHALYGNVVFRVFEVGLLFGLLYHALNGLPFTDDLPRRIIDVVLPPPGR